MERTIPKPVVSTAESKAALSATEPKLLETMKEEHADRDLQEKLLRRLAERAEAVEVDIDDL